MIDKFGTALDEPIATPETPLSKEEKAARLKEIRDYYKDDLYATEATGLVIDDAVPGWAQVSMDIVPRVLNAKGGVMGGAMFTMADFAASIADYQAGWMNMSIDSQMQFIHLAKGTRLIATAIAEYRGRSVGYYRIRIEDDLGTLVATSSFTCMHRPLDRA